MNIEVRATRQFRSPALRATSQAAEGMERRRFSVAEIEAMVEAGIIVVPMSPKGNRHEILKSRLNRYWAKRCPEHLDYTPETTFRLSEDTFLEPDFVFYRVVDDIPNLKPQTCLLAVEVADTSLGYDLGRKARLYAGFGISELWVIDAQRLETHVHRQPGIEGYRDVRTVPGDRSLEPGCASELAVTLTSLRLAPTREAS
jgi:Uma2 family endonuclease